MHQCVEWSISTIHTYMLEQVRRITLLLLKILVSLIERILLLTMNVLLLINWALNIQLIRSLSGLNILLVLIGSVFEHCTTRS